MPLEAGLLAPAEAPLNEVGGLLPLPEVRPRGLPEVLERACSKTVGPSRGPACAAAQAGPPVPVNGPAPGPAEGLLIPVGEILRMEACSAAVVPSFRRSSKPAPACGRFCAAELSVAVSWVKA